ncbi:MAG: DUF1080 domain-containing protein [Planctomycetia bacterium]
MLRLFSCFALLTCLLSGMLILPVLSSTLAIAAEDPTDILNQEAKEGFVSLFDGKTLDGWIGKYKGIKAKDGMIMVEEGCRGAILTEKSYGDFVLRFDFRLHPGTNNGLIIRCPKDKRPPKDGMEIQIIDNSAKRYAKLKDYQFHGSLYFVAPAKRGFLKKVGEWNTQEVSCIDNKLKITLNDHVILDIDMDEFDPEHTLGKHPVPALKYDKGHIGFLCHHDPIEIRNLRIKEPKKEEKPAEKKCE